MNKNFVTVSTEGKEDELYGATCIRYKDGEEVDRVKVSVTTDGVETCAKKMLPFLGTQPIVVFSDTDFDRLNNLYMQDKIIFRASVMNIMDAVAETFPEKSVSTLAEAAALTGGEETVASVYNRLSMLQPLTVKTRHIGGEMEEVEMTEGRIFAQKVKDEINKINSAQERKAKYLELVSGKGNQRINRETGAVYSADEGFRDIEERIMDDIKSEEDNKRYENKEKRRKMLGIVGIVAAGFVLLYFVGLRELMMGK